ncbi:MAG: hypothetical protein K0R18_65 [Bacillales bacterium]|jgi:hypothetical protein|nr:hypothetical protein [Bacillales bacterium]
MSIFERMAELKSDILNATDRDLKVVVYDTEAKDPSKPVAWLNANFQYEGNTPNLLYVDVIDFDDDALFSMPKNRKDMCGAVLLKKFMRYYRDNFGKDNKKDNPWLPVGANFINYEIQEKFDKLLDSGMFPPQSNDHVQRTTKDQFNKELHYNKDNREMMHNIKTNPGDYFTTLHIENNYSINDSLSEINSALEKFTKEFPEAAENSYRFDILSGHIKDGNVYVMLPVNDELPSDQETSFQYYKQEGNLFFENAFTLEDAKNFVGDNKENIKKSFDAVQTIQCINTDKLPVGSLFNDNTEASMIKRLIKRSK